LKSNPHPDALLYAHQARSGFSDKPRLSGLTIPTTQHLHTGRVQPQDPGMMNLALAQQLVQHENTGVAPDDSTLRNPMMARAPRIRMVNRQIDYVQGRTALIRSGPFAQHDEVFLGEPNKKTVFNRTPHASMSQRAAAGVSNSQHVEMLADAKKIRKQMMKDAKATLKQASGVAAYNHAITGARQHALHDNFTSQMLHRAAATNDTTHVNAHQHHTQPVTAASHNTNDDGNTSGTDTEQNPNTFESMVKSHSIEIAVAGGVLVAITAALLT
jgi:hypothetical protein